jgi:hypothetical protein
MERDLESLDTRRILNELLSRLSSLEQIAAEAERREKSRIRNRKSILEAIKMVDSPMVCAFALLFIFDLLSRSHHL